MRNMPSGKPWCNLNRIENRPATHWRCGRINILALGLLPEMNAFEIDRIRRTPAYSFVEAAHYLNLPVSTLSSWFKGQAGFRPILRQRRQAWRRDFVSESCRGSCAGGDSAGVPIKLYPFTRKPATNAEPEPVVIDPCLAFGRPVLAGRAVPTAVLADRFKAGDSLNELALDHDISSQAIEEAIRCELSRRKAA